LIRFISCFFLFVEVLKSNMSEVNVSPSLQSNKLPLDDNKEDETEEVKVVATGSIVQVKDQTSGQVIEAVVIDQEELNKLKDEDNNLNIDNSPRSFQSAQVLGNTSSKEKVAQQEQDRTKSDNAVVKRKQSSLEKVFSSVSRKLSKASATLSNKSRSSKKEDKNKDDYTYEYTYAEIEEGKAPEDGRRKSEEKVTEAAAENKEVAAPSRKTTPAPEVKKPEVETKPSVKVPAAKPVTQAPAAKAPVTKAPVATKAPVTKPPVAKPVAAPKKNTPPPQEAPANKKRKDSLFKRFLIKIKVWRRKKKPKQSN